MNRRTACRLLTAAPLAARSAFADEAAGHDFRLRYLLNSAMFGTMPLDVILPEIAKTGSEAIDIWCLKHGNQREQIEEMGHDASAALLARHDAKVGAFTRYPLGPFGLQDEMKVAQRFGAKVLVCGSTKAPEPSGAEAKAGVRAFLEKMKPHVAAAEEHGVTIAIENHDRQLLYHPDSLRYFAEFNRSPHLGIAFAFHHLHKWEAEIPALLRDLGGGQIPFIYFQEHSEGIRAKAPKEVEMQQMPGFGGGLDYEPIVKALKEIRYDGWVEIFMHPVPRGIPILPTAAEITAAINKSREVRHRMFEGGFITPRPVRGIALGIAWAAAAVAAGPLGAEHPMVPGFERFHSGDDQPSQEAGRLLLGELHCIQCHTAPDAHSVLPAHQVPVLDGTGNRLQADWIRAFLTDPQGTKPGTTMPDVLAGHPEEERTRQVDALVHYLVSLKKGKLVKLAKYSAPLTGGKIFERVGCAACHADPVRTDPEDSHRAAGLVSLEGLPAKYSYAGLTTFLADPLTHRPGGRMPDLHLDDQEAADVAAYILDTTDEAENRARAPLRPFKIDPDRAALGEKLFTTAGCASCHRVQNQGAGPGVPPLADLLGKRGGCLEAAPARGRPHYPLSAAQRAALRHALADPLAPMNSGDRVHLTVKAFNCYACHMRCGIGGPTPDRQPFFTGDVTLGNEGRFPPHLTDVGRKLTKAALTNILAGKGGIRPYLHTRMPDFGAANVGHLVRDFPEADDLAGVAKVDPRRADAEAGRILMGTRGGVGCITCHGVQNRKALAMDAPGLDGATERYHPAWFREYLINPSALRPGTVMPSFWPDGVAGNRAILEGDTGRQIASIWEYLAKDTEPPPGFPDFDAGEFEIIPTDHPVVQRTMMDGAGSQTIAVGFPAGMHLAFDSEHCRPALMWKGRFIDGYNTWFSRKDPSATPLGTDLIPFPRAGILNLPVSAIPRFRGYELDAAGIPTFRYLLGTIEVTDRFEPADAGFLRSLGFKGTGAVTIAPGEVPGMAIKLLRPASPVLKLSKDAGQVVDISYHWSP